MISLMKRVIRQMKNDKRSVALILFAPLLVMTLVYFLLGDTDYVPTIAVDESALPSIFVTELKKQDAEIINLSLDSLSIDIEQYLKDNKDIDAVIDLTTGVYMLEASAKSRKALEVIQSTMAELNPLPQSLETVFVYGSADEPLFSSMGYLLLGIFSFFFVFIISGMALVRERSSGTLERLLMSPVRRYEVITGYTAGYGFFAVIQAALMVLYSVFVLGLNCEGNVAWVILTMLLLAVAAVSFGAMVSIFAATEFQVVQMIPVVLVPQVFFSGLIPLETIPYNLGYIGYIMPVFYGCSAIKSVMTEGGGLAEIWHLLLILTAFILLMSFINTKALKKYRKL